jgi:hypothetical protein
MIGRFISRVILFVREYWKALVPILLVAYALDAFRSYLIIRIINWALYGLVIVGQLAIFAGGLIKFRLSDGRLSDLPALFVLNRQSPSGVAHDVAITMMNLGLLLTLTAAIMDRGWLSLGAFIFTVGLSFAFRLVAPPLLLYLAQSSDQSHRLANQLAEGLSPHRIIHQLTLPGDDLAGDGVMRASVLRTNEEENWRESIEILMRLSRIIVLDSRGSTIPLEEEARMILGSDVIQKAVFISDEHGKCKILRAVMSQRLFDPNTRIIVMSESLLLATIDKLSNNPRIPLPMLFFVNSQVIRDTL